MKALTDSAVASIITTSLFGVFLNLFLKLGINKLLNMLKRLQIIIYILLIQIYLVAHAEEFIETLLKIIAFQLYDLSGIFKKIFDVEES